MTTYGYRRVSSQGQQDGGSLEQQATKITGLAMMQDLGEVTFVQDVCSGSVPLGDRPGGKGMMTSLKKGDVVIAAKLDRLFRDAEDALALANHFKRIGVDLYLIDMGSDCVTQNGVSKLFFTILVGMAEFERNRIRERTAEGRANKKAKGGHIGGTRPFGYNVVGTGREAVLTPREGEHEYVAQIIERSKTDSLRKISAWLEERGVKLSHVGVKGVIEREAAKVV